jgi:hypothetical protein
MRRRRLGDTLPWGNKAQAPQHPDPAREGVKRETKLGLFGNGDETLIESLALPTSPQFSCQNYGEDYRLKSCPLDKEASAIAVLISRFLWARLIPL